jgi:acyl-coenzyme A thioesterase PaaI-like protein
MERGIRLIALTLSIADGEKPGSAARKGNVSMDVSQAILEAVPFNRFIGIEVGEIASDRVTLSLPLRPDLANHVGSMHAAAQFALGEAVCGALALLTFADRIESVVPLNARSSIDYRRPSQGGLTARGVLSREEQDRARADFAAKGKARVTTMAELFVAGGAEPVTTVTVEWVVIPRPA